MLSFGFLRADRVQKSHWVSDGLNHKAYLCPPGSSKQTTFVWMRWKSHQQTISERSSISPAVMTLSLQSQVVSLLEARLKSGKFLESPAIDFVAAAVSRPIEQVGDSIGPYKLVEKIGEGGMGLVYRAEQTGPMSASRPEGH